MATLNQVIVYLLQTAISLFLIAVLLRFLLQLARADFYNPISQFLVKATNPLLLPLRKIIPGLAGLMLSAVAVTLTMVLFLSVPDLLVGVFVDFEAMGVVPVFLGGQLNGFRIVLGTHLQLVWVENPQAYSNGLRFAAL